MKVSRRLIIGLVVSFLHLFISVILVGWVLASESKAAETVLMVFAAPATICLYTIEGPMPWQFMLLCNSMLWGYVVSRFVKPRIVDARLCTACGYDLRGNTSGVCPECGKPLESLQLSLLSSHADDASSESVLETLMDEE